MPRPIVCQPYYNLLNRMPEVEILPACAHYGIGLATYSPVARGVLTGKYAKDVVPADSRAAHKDRRMMETEFREESFAVAAKLKAHAENGRAADQFCARLVWANSLVSAVIPARARWRMAGLRCIGGTAWNDADEALVDNSAAGPRIHARFTDRATLLRPTFAAHSRDPPDRATGSRGQRQLAR